MFTSSKTTCIYLAQCLLHKQETFIFWIKHGGDICSTWGTNTGCQQLQAEFRWDHEDVTEEIGRRRWRCNQEGLRPRWSVSEESLINHSLTCIQQFRLLIESPSAIIEARYCISSGLLYQMRHLLSVNLHRCHTVFLFLRCNKAPYLCSDHLLSPETLNATVLYTIIRSESCQ